MMEYINFVEDETGIEFFVKRDYIIGFSKGIGDFDSYIYLKYPIALGAYESKAINVKGSLLLITKYMLDESFTCEDFIQAYNEEIEKENEKP